MERRNFLKTTALAAAGLPLMSHLRWQESSYKVISLRRNVGIFFERGGTIGWYQRKGDTALVDAQFPDTAEHLVKALELSQGQKADVLWNTHHHGDHTNGNSVLQEYTGKIVAHEQVPVLQREQIESRGGDEDLAVYADTTFSDTYQLSVGKETITGYHYGPGHTGGDSVVHFEKANVVHVGDLIFNQVYPYIDYGGGADLKQWVAHLAKMEADFDKDTLFIFGHSDSPELVTGSKEDLANKRAYLEQLISTVEEAKQQGQSKAEILELTPFDENRRELWQGAWKHNLEAAMTLLA
ncbi:MAG: MBL fold metallo-hydrolase [Bacteroidota bacterium]